MTDHSYSNEKRTVTKILLSLILVASFVMNVEHTFAEDAKNNDNSTAHESLHGDAAIDSTEENTPRKETSWFEGWKLRSSMIFDRAFDKNGQMILGIGALATVATFAVDHRITDAVRNESFKVSDSLSSFGSRWGGGSYTSYVILLQLLTDYDNGIAHMEAFFLASMTSGMLKHIVQRERPNKASKLSFPSGHMATATTAAVSLWYAYGWPVGVPASILAAIAGAARISDGVHYTSDVIAGAVIAAFWARATAIRKDDNIKPYFDISRGVIGWEYKF